MIFGALMTAADSRRSGLTDSLTGVSNEVGHQVQVARLQRGSIMRPGASYL
jgi:hypothetical protein